ncbi:cobalamin B12-binding domain-containing protein [Sulfitobacter sp. HNIBRBA3233]|uniref:cobalamin B12-binding domain-containing protein n=1 Tax=Sulfitobacter marinivivus TaxID=3158558 RepID=UPI0032DE779D
MRRDPEDYATRNPAHRVGGVARRVLSVLSQELKGIYPDLPDCVLVRYLEQMEAAILHPGVERADKVLNLMRRSGIRDADIADFYIPVIARRLGEGWVADTLDFAAVTTGSARLQDMLRRLDSSWCTPADKHIGMRGEYCVIVPEGVQHSLGARILAGQLRRAGCNVHLKIELPVAQIAQTVGSADFRGVFVSATSRESLDFLRCVVTQARDGNAWSPVLLGGNVLERGFEVDSVVGADFATNDWSDALRFCERRVEQ